MQSNKAQITGVAENLRILVMRYSSLGDVALTLPALDELAAHYRKAEITFATKAEYAEVVQHHPAVKRVLTLDGSDPMAFFSHLGELKELKPHVVLDLHDSLRTRLLTWRLKPGKLVRYDKESVRRRMLAAHRTKEPSTHTVWKYVRALRGLGIQAAGTLDFTVPVPKNTQYFLKDTCDRLGVKHSDSVVGLAPGAAWETKKWPASRWALLADRLVERYGARIWWFGSPGERSEIENVRSSMIVPDNQRGKVLAGERSLGETIQLLGRCDLFVGHDSGLTHLAAGRGCRVVAIFGSTTPSLGFAPWGPHNTIIENAKLDCRPCHVHGRDSCPKGHFKCMEDLSVDLVEGAVSRAMKRNH
jgi:lipopolysaccharide heptosyltransferase II